MLQESGFDDLYPDFARFCLDQQTIHGAANKRMIEAVRCNPNIKGYCIHALAAGDWILGAGLIDLWRQPKSYAYEATRAANQPRILSIRMSPRNVYASRGSELAVVGVNEMTPLKATLTVQVVSAAGETVFRRETDLDWKEGISQLFAAKLDTRALRGSCTVKALVSAEDGSIVAENTHTFDVFAEQDLALTEARIAVLDLEGPLTQFLKQRGISVLDFDASTPQSIPVFVTSVKPVTQEDQKRFADLMMFIEQGGTAVYVRGVGSYFGRGGRNQIRSATVPFAGRVQIAQGKWTCIPHLVRDHPIFAGLPADGMMRDIYENVWATQTLRDLPQEPIVASIGFDWYPQNRKWYSQDYKLHYSGPGESWWGADLVIVPKGQGRLVVSQLRIVQNLGKDPVADKLLRNLIEFVADR
jgi:hypothetical protein